MKYSALLIIAILVIAGTTVTSVAVYDYYLQIDEKPVIVDEPIVEEIVIDEPAPVQAQKTKHSDYEILKQKYDQFLSNYNALVLINRDVIPYPINYSYVSGEGFTDTAQGKEWCGKLVGHTDEIKSLLDALNESMAEGQALENKTPQIIKLLDEKYGMLSELMTKEIKTFEGKIHWFDCQTVISDQWSVPHE